MLLGCTPLHWAAIGGNMEVCTVLVHAGTKQELTVKDKAGFTPIQLASDKGHRHVALFLVRNFVIMFPLVVYFCTNQSYRIIFNVVMLKIETSFGGVEMLVFKIGTKILHILSLG